MQKVHVIDVVLSRGVKIAEEEQENHGKSIGTSKFSDYERQ